MPADAQSTDSVVMVRPSSFGFDPETAESNPFQTRSRLSPDALAATARAEFESAVASLQAAGVGVIIHEDPPHCPDAVFPNNWFSTHGPDGYVLYPMLGASRRRERLGPVGEWLRSAWGEPALDLTGHESEGRFLEGTGSLVLDRANRVAYASPSPRTDPDLVRLWCERMGYLPHIFRASDEAGRPYYHTNVVLAVGAGVAVAGLESVHPEDRAGLAASLEERGREVVALDRGQLARFAANGLELRTPDGPVFALSATALGSLRPDQLEVLARHARPLPIAIPTIEDVGGGSARCILAEVFRG